MLLAAVLRDTIVLIFGPSSQKILPEGSVPPNSHKKCKVLHLEYNSHVLYREVKK